MNINPGIVLILNHNRSQATQLQTDLHIAGYTGKLSNDSLELLNELKSKKASAIILDWNLSDEKPIAAIKRVRNLTMLPIIVTSEPVSVEARVDALMSGADDFLTRPFASEELMARLGSILRRIEKKNVMPKTVKKIVMGEVQLDISTRQLEGPQGKTKLTEKESIIILTLAGSPRFVSRKNIYPEVFGRPWAREDHVLEVHIHHLRKKFKTVSNLELPLQSNRSFGYRLESNEVFK